MLAETAPAFLSLNKLSISFKHHVMDRRDLEPYGGKKRCYGTQEHDVPRHAEPHYAGWPNKNGKGRHDHADKSHYNANDMENL